MGATWARQRQGMHRCGPLLQYSDMPEEYRRSPLGQRTSYARVIQQPPGQIFKTLFYVGEGVRGGDKTEMLVLQPLFNTTTTTITTNAGSTTTSLLFLQCGFEEYHKYFRWTRL